MADHPTIRPAEAGGWPKLVVRYRTDQSNIDALLPPGLEPLGEPIVQIGIYCVPVHGEPEFGVSTKVPASYDGIEGMYSLGVGIDQESAIFISRETNGQPKYPCDVQFYRLGDEVHARATHQGYTFVEYHGTATEMVEHDDEPTEDNEWWIKHSRAVGGVAGEYDYPPHVVRVRTMSAPRFTAPIDGELLLRDSPWDPHTRLLPCVSLESAELVHNVFTARDITNAGPLDPDAFWPFADTIGGSRWPGRSGAPPAADDDGGFR